MNVNDRWNQLVTEAVSSTRYGQIVITVHDGRVVQIDRTEKTRLESEKREPRRETAGGRFTQSRPVTAEG